MDAKATAGLSDADIATIAEQAALEMFRKLGTSREPTYNDLFDARMCIEEAINEALRQAAARRAFAADFRG